MIDWKFDETDVVEYSLIPEGKHLCRINKVTEKTSQNGHPQLEIELSISGYSRRVWDRITFNPENSKNVNTTLKNFWRSFGLPKTLNTATWAGKVGCVNLRHSKWQDKTYEKVWFYCDKPSDAQWVEGNGSVTGSTTAEQSVSNDDLPFY